MNADEVTAEGAAFGMGCIPGATFICQQIAKSIIWQPAHITAGIRIRPNIWGGGEAAIYLPVKTDLFRINNTVSFSFLNHKASGKLGDRMSAIRVT